jgi:hypothetical protein
LPVSAKNPGPSADGTNSRRTRVSSLPFLPGGEAAGITPGSSIPARTADPEMRQVNRAIPKLGRALCIEASRNLMIRKIDCPPPTAGQCRLIYLYIVVFFNLGRTVRRGEVKQVEQNQAIGNIPTGATDFRKTWETPTIEDSSILAATLKVACPPECDTGSSKSSS